MIWKAIKVILLILVSPFLLFMVADQLLWLLFFAIAILPAMITMNYSSKIGQIGEWLFLLVMSLSIVWAIGVIILGFQYIDIFYAFISKTVFGL